MRRTLFNWFRTTAGLSNRDVLVLFAVYLSGTFAAGFLCTKWILLSSQVDKQSSEVYLANPLQEICQFGIDTEITQSVLSKFRAWLADIQQPTAGCRQATVFLMSGGGSVNVAMEIIALISTATLPIHTVCLSGCDSSALIIFANGTGKRIVTNYATGIFHRPYFVEGTSEKYQQHINTQIFQMFFPKFPKDLRTSIAKGEDVLLTGAELLKYGLADTLIDLPAKQTSKVLDVTSYVLQSVVSPSMKPDRNPSSVEGNPERKCNP